MNTTSTGNLTATEFRAKADHWLDKAVELEDAGKSDSMVNRALKKACEYEDFAIARTA